MSKSVELKIHTKKKNKTNEENFALEYKKCFLPIQERWRKKEVAQISLSSLKRMSDDYLFLNKKRSRHSRNSSGRSNTSSSTTTSSSLRHFNAYETPQYKENHRRRRKEKGSERERRD
ncbi:hypothetical protein CSUI_004780 [Cystoisospora suis]|uniref:Uncharacterized protein n=1 Tax=Cystoisospora suis TaxID=483139 RepID=A0A2C6KZQ1_9APIC|nr:hypothetical protein CSUI_004780 [Cystoisospora suis]